MSRWLQAPRVALSSAELCEVVFFRATSESIFPLQAQTQNATEIASTFHAGT
jgi:hypothetical protein